MVKNATTQIAGDQSNAVPLSPITFAAGELDCCPSPKGDGTILGRTNRRLGTGTYRWFHRLVSPLGTVVLAHPFLLRATVQRRSKTDRLDAQLLANLLRINQIPLSYIPSDEYQLLRDVTRYRARLGRGLATVKTSLRALLARHNREALYKYPFGPRGLYWFSKQTFRSRPLQAA